jgi:hypothetical protein
VAKPNRYDVFRQNCGFPTEEEEAFWEERCRSVYTSVPDPQDPHVFGPPGSGCFYHQTKKNKKNLDSYCFETSFGLFIFEK